MNNPTMKYTRRWWQWQSRLICVPAAMLFFVLSAQAQTDWSVKIRTGGEPRFHMVDAEINSLGNISWIVVAPKTMTDAGEAKGGEHLFFNAELTAQERDRVAKLVLGSDPAKWAQAYKWVAIHSYSTQLTLERRERLGEVIYLVRQYSVRVKDHLEPIPEDLQSLQGEVLDLVSKYEAGAPVKDGVDISGSEHARDHQWDTVRLISSDMGTPISNARVVLHNLNRINCVTAPCPSSETFVKARSDARGAVLTPSSFIQVGTTIIRVEGYAVGDLPKDLRKISEHEWELKCRKINGDVSPDELRSTAPQVASVLLSCGVSSIHIATRVLKLTLSGSEYFADYSCTGRCESEQVHGKKVAVGDVSKRSGRIEGRLMGGEGF